MAKKKSDKKSVDAIVAHRAVEVAEIESLIATAKRYPRDIAVFKDKLMTMANLDQETAEACYYALPRGDKVIDGPSIRLAEIALSCYGNCIAEGDVLNEDDKFIYATGQCRDLENNVAIKMKVRRRITDRRGRRFNDDMIAVTANAACSIALRNAILKVIPGAFVKPVFDQVKHTAVGNVKSLVQRRVNVMAKLTQFGVKEDRILAILNRRSVDELTFDDVAKLIGLGTAIYDGDTTVEEAFPLLVNGKKGNEGLKDRLHEREEQSTQDTTEPAKGEELDDDRATEVARQKAELAAAEQEEAGAEETEEEDKPDQPDLSGDTASIFDN